MFVKKEIYVVLDSNYILFGILFSCEKQSKYGDSV
jgi:hypothetical protein